MTAPCFIHLPITLPPSNLICHWMASRRQSIVVWCGGTEIPAASHLSIKVTLAQRTAHSDDPVVLPNGRKLLTLRDAANYITALQKAEHDAAGWQVAMETLLLVAERDRSEMTARIWTMR